MSRSTPHQAGPPRERFGPYIVEDKIGAGGMATVYRARHINSQSRIALKVLAIYLSGHEDVRRRFEREARTLIQFSHPHILPVFDFGEDRGTPYIALRLLSGRSLTTPLKNAPLPLSQIGRLTRQIASALDYAHARGIIHRDVKPANILLDDKNFPYLADFGVAYLTESDPGARLTQVGSFVGTAAYASPEQCRGEALGRPSDVYSLAVMVFQMATGKLPFEAASPLATIKLHMHEAPPNPLAFNNTLPIQLYHVLVKALAKLAKHRYPSAMKFSEAIDAALGLHALPTANAEPDNAAANDWLYGDLSPVSPDDELVTPHTPSRDYAPAANSSPPTFDTANTFGDGIADLEFDNQSGPAFEDTLDFDAQDEFELPDEADPRFITDDYPSVNTVLRDALAGANPGQRKATLPSDPSAGRTRDGSRTVRNVAYVVIAIALLIIIGGGVVILRALNQTESLALDTPYRSPAFGITFDYPAAWHISEGKIAVLSAVPTGTLHISDQVILPGGDTGAASIVIAIQRIDPVDVYGVPEGCAGHITSGPEPTFGCMAGQNYTTPDFSALTTPTLSGGAKLAGTLPPTRASLPLILLPTTTSEPTWIAVMIVHWSGFEDAPDLLERVAKSVR